ncbi:hypothetical protein HanIR_Chr13g0654771 [Helianthus annuus]|nr:hypothetical protein HanIR_Chr13g0654771 [Helianthus annuus]
MRDLYTGVEYVTAYLIRDSRIHLVISFSSASFSSGSKYATWLWRFSDMISSSVLFSFFVAGFLLPSLGAISNLKTSTISNNYLHIHLDMYGYKFMYPFDRQTVKPCPL